MPNITRAAGVLNLLAGIYLAVLVFVGERLFSFHMGALKLAAPAFLTAGLWLARGRNLHRGFAVFYVFAAGLFTNQIYADEGLPALAHLVGVAVVLSFSVVAFYRLSKPLEPPPRPGSGEGLKVMRTADAEQVRTIPARPPDARRSAEDG